MNQFTKGITKGDKGTSFFSFSFFYTYHVTDPKPKALKDYEVKFVKLCVKINFFFIIWLSQIFVLFFAGKHAKRKDILFYELWGLLNSSTGLEGLEPA